MTGTGDESAPAPSAQVLDRLHSALRDVPELLGEPRTVQALEGGLTNFNFKVTTPGRTVVVRLSSSDGDLLSIDREAEHTNSLRAAASGAAPAVVGYLPEHRALVVEWVEGRTLTAPDLRDESMLVRVGEVCRRLHSGERFDGDFDMFAIQRRYLAIVQERGFRLPEGYLDLMPQVDRIADALAVRQDPTVPATTTCSRPTSSTTASACGSSTTSTAATTTRASSSATSGASPSSPWTSSRSWSTATSATTSGTRSPGRGCSA